MPNVVPQEEWITPPALDSISVVLRGDCNVWLKWCWPSPVQSCMASAKEQLRTTRVPSRGSSGTSLSASSEARGRPASAQPQRVRKHLAGDRTVTIVLWGPRCHFATCAGVEQTRTDVTSFPSPFCLSVSPLLVMIKPRCTLSLGFLSDCTDLTILRNVVLARMTCLEASGVLRPHRLPFLSAVEGYGEFCSARNMSKLSSTRVGRWRRRPAFCPRRTHSLYGQEFMAPFAIGRVPQQHSRWSSRLVRTLRRWLIRNGYRGK